MYLTDDEIESRLDEFAFVSEDANHPFNPEKQIGPCSVDLRLSGQFWRLRPKWRRGARPIRIGRISLEEVKPRRQWKRVQLRDTQTLRLAPREMVIARTAERFTVPPNCVAFVHGRSSYARLGLSVHPSAGFINPGWSGQFPLPLMNESDATLEIPRFTAVCQVLLVELSKAPRVDYTARASKYQQDDGGPSYWWRDKVLAQLVADLPGNLGDNLVRDLGDALAQFPEDLVHALDEYFDGAPERSWSDADALLDDFARSERLKSWRSSAYEVAATGAGAGLLGSALFADFPLPGLVALVVGLVSIVLGGRHIAFRREYFDERRLNELRRPG